MAGGKSPIRVLIFVDVAEATDAQFAERRLWNVLRGLPPRSVQAKTLTSASSIKSAPERSQPGTGEVTDRTVRVPLSTAPISVVNVYELLPVVTAINFDSVLYG